MMFLWIVPLMLVVWLVLGFEARSSDRGFGPAQPVAYDPAVSVVRERYARGEIGKEDYERLVAELLGRG